MSTSIGKLKGVKSYCYWSVHYEFVLLQKDIKAPLVCVEQHRCMWMHVKLASRHFRGQKRKRFRISHTFSFDFMRTVWWCLSCSIGNVWTFVELQLTALSAPTPMQVY